MQLHILLLVGLLGATSLGLDEQFKPLIEKGKQRKGRIDAAKVDTTRNEDLSTWDLDTASDVDLTTAYRELDTVNAAGNLGLGSKITKRGAVFPKDRDKDDEGQIGATFELYVDPSAGVILAENIYKNPDAPKQPDRSIADVAWSIYKEAASGRGGDGKNLKTILQTDITAEFAPELLSSLWDPLSEDDKKKPLTYTDLNSDEALAIMGLDTGALVDGLLEYHNVAMGGKKMSSVSIFASDDDVFDVWWTLESPSSQRKSRLRYRR